MHSKYNVDRWHYLILSEQASHSPRVIEKINNTSCAGYHTVGFFLYFGLADGEVASVEISIEGAFFM